MSMHSAILANDLPPVAVQQVSSPGRSYFYSGETVTFSGAGSYDQDESGASVTYYEWYVDGVYKAGGTSKSTWTNSFSVAGGQTTVHIKLRVRDDENNWSEQTTSYTVKAKPGRVYYLKDHLGSVRTSVDENGHVIGYDDYYPFGLTMPGRSSNTGNPNDNYKYIGEELDDEAGLNLMHLNARMMDPVLGRFMHVDPITHTLKPRELFDLHNGKHFGYSPYAYVFNNPLKYTDPTGLSPEDPEEIARFRQAEISTGLQHMLNLMNENGVEIAALMVQDGDGNVDLVVFDFSNNTADESFVKTDGESATSKFYKGSEVIAQIHTHTNNNPTPSGDDQGASRQLRAPVFTLTNDNMGVTIGGPTTGFSDNPSLGRSFKESVVNRGQSDRLVRHARNLKGIIDRRRRN